LYYFYMNNITVKDIARICGVSIGSVDRAIHDRPGISEKTKNRILDVCKREDFVLNRFAQSLARKPLRLAAIIPDKGDEFYRVIEKGLQQGAKDLQDFNVSLTIRKTSILGWNEETALMERFREDEYDGVAVCAGHVSKLDKTINRLDKTGIPVVTMASDAPASRRRACVAVPPELNGANAAAYMARFIKGKGGRVGVIAGRFDIDDHRLKAEGFKRKLAELRPDLEEVIFIETEEEPARLKEAVNELAGSDHHGQLKSPLKGLFIVTYGGLYCARELERLTLDSDVVFFSVFGGQGGVVDPLIPYLEKGTLDMLIDQKPFEQGLKAVHLLFDLLTDKDVAQDRIWVRPEYLIRESLAFFN